MARLCGVIFCPLCRDTDAKCCARLWDARGDSGMPLASMGSMRVWITLVAALWSVCSYVGIAWACPSCPVGRAAREQVCEDNFVLRLLAVVLPFVVMGLVSVGVERAMRQRARGNV